MEGHIWNDNPKKAARSAHTYMLFYENENKEQITGNS